MKKLVREYWKLILVLLIPYLFVIVASFVRVNYDVVTPASITNVCESIDINNNLSYDSNKMTVRGDNSFILDTHVYNEDEAETIWTISFKVKEDAEIRDGFIADQVFSIIENNDIDLMLSKGIKSAPCLEIDGEILDPLKVT